MRRVGQVCAQRRCLADSVSSSRRANLRCRWQLRCSTTAEQLGAAEALVGADQRLSTLQRAKHYLVLGKYKLTGLVTFTAGCGYVVAGGSLLNPAFAATLAGTYLQGMSANTLNQVREKPFDATMKRTRMRPLVTGAISETEALAVALTQLGTGTACLLFADPTAAALGVGCWALYVSVYTSMKRKHWLNTWVGAIVGAIPPVMGTVAAGSTVMSPVSVLLGGLLYLWQIPHFLSLAYLHRRDYAAAGFKMLPSEDTARATNFSLRYCVYTTALMVAVPIHFHICDPAFAVEALVLGAAWTRTAWSFHNEPLRYARMCFLASIIYLPVILVLLVFHARARGSVALPPSLLCPLAAD
eukprot:TRINITY_DN1698_c10_g1_i1.p1 TRINITY_DN1698_c10_g1~~TRINITY_DN1698_c10_g1_i1.p1  ORF type:complete len:356 (+),score=55.53 TRINITY_DN1698_c10_g1_i1:305-1372(+)